MSATSKNGKIYLFRVNSFKIDWQSKEMSQRDGKIEGENYDKK